MAWDGIVEGLVEVEVVQLLQVLILKFSHRFHSLAVEYHGFAAPLRRSGVQELMV